MKKMQGSADIELNEKGLSQANDTAAMLKDITFDIIFCSPLKRARQTAEIINDDRGLNIIFKEKISDEELLKLEKMFEEYIGKNNTYIEGYTPKTKRISKCIKKQRKI